MALLREGESGQLIQGTATGDVLTWDESDQEWFAAPVSGLGISRPIVSNCSFFGYELLVSDRVAVRLAGPCHWRSTSNPIVVFGGGYVNAAAIASGSVGNTNVGVTVRASGGYSYSTGNQPTVVGASAAKIGGTSFATYSMGANGFVDLQLNAVPPTQTTLVGTPAYMVVEV
jgi:hypothetical protein